MKTKTIFLVLLSAVLITAVFFIDPIPQDQAYYAFADTRSILGVPNFWNVLSNLPFLLAGGAGFYYSSSNSRAGISPGLQTAYLVFFAGIFLTGFGSAYFHYAPGNETLVWDRLPMTIGFMGLVTIIVGEHISLPAARRMLIPLLIIGAGSVVFWAVTESRGVGDLRPYAIVQFLPMLLIPLILLMYRSIYDNVDFLWFVIVLYALSKLFEYFDKAIFDLLWNMVSGHTLKHIAASIGAYTMLLYVKKRSIVGG